MRPLIGNFLSMASLRVGSAAVTFALFWYLSHHLSASDLGGFSLLMNAFFMVQALPLLGMAMPLMRRVAARPADVCAETSSSLCFALPVAALIGGGLAIAGHWYAAEGLVWPFALVGLSIVPTAWTLVAESVLVGREQMYGIAYVNILETVGRLVGAIAVVKLGFGLTGVFLVFVCLRFAAALAYLLNPQVPALRWHFVQRQHLAAYRREFPTYLSIAVVTALCTRSDLFVVSKLLSLKDAGIYAAASRLSDAALMVPTMAAIVVFPTQSRLFESDPLAFCQLLERAVRWCLIGGFALALLVVTLSPLITGLIYAPRLAAPAAPILELLILGSTLMVIDQILSTTMMAARAQHADLRSMSVGLVVLIALMFTCIHFFGLMGAGMAPPAALLLRILYRLSWAQRVLQRPVLVMAVRVLIAAGGAVAVLFLDLAPGKISGLLLSLAVYAFGLWVTRGLGPTDFHALRKFVTAHPDAGA